MGHRIGQQLGNYRLTRLLGLGGFAEVYLAKHTLLGTTTAIKVLRTQVVLEDVEQFQREARILASLKHPHIVRILDFGIEERLPYLTMEYAPNGTLRTYHPKGSVLPVATVVDYVKQVAQALQYAHERKIVHRDIKPENMLVGEQNEILLSDFGIALVAQSLSYQNTADMAGTIAYMAPEQIAGHPGTASDQYALAVVAYEWLCGTPPFRGSFTEIAAQHSVTPPTPLLKHIPTLLPDIDYVILTALAKRPEDRFVSIRAFANAFEQASLCTFPTEQARSVPLFPPLPPLKPTGPLAITPTRPVSPFPRPAELSGKLTIPVNQSLSASGLAIADPLDLPAPTEATKKTPVSRRAVLIEAGVVMVAVGAEALLVLYPSSQPQPSVYQPFAYQEHLDVVWGVTWSPDGKYIASGSRDKTVQVWNTSDKSPVLTYSKHSDTVYTVAWSPDGQRIASGSADATVQVWNSRGVGNPLIYVEHTEAVLLVAWSPDGKHIASGSRDKTVQVWNASDGSNILIYIGHSDKVCAVAWSPDGKHIASGSRDKTVQVWNASNGGNILTYMGHSDTVETVAWSPDGKRIASGSADKTVRVWNANDGSTILTYTGHPDTVYTVAWSPDGQRIASGSADKTVQVWNASDGRQVFTYKWHTKVVESVAWSLDGKRIASGSADKTVQVWTA